jgi:negative regulator of sigma E activity
MSSEELHSQLSAMFDDELPAAQCELLARRLARDEALKARWGRYAAIGAAIRSERGVRLNGNLARRVSLLVSSEPSLAAAAKGGGRELRMPLAMRRWGQPLAGAALAAGVAVLAVLWMRDQVPADAGLLAHDGGAPGATVPGLARPPAAAPQPDSYTVPTLGERPGNVPPAQLANYVVAHSQFSAPLIRRNVLSALVAGEVVAPPSPSAPSAATNTRSGVVDAAQAR